MNIRTISGLASVGAMGMALAATPAVAQQVVPAAATQDSGIAEIIVTAQRRTESVQKSSLSIQVLSKDDLVRSGAVGPRDLNGLVPGLAVAQGGTFTQTFIRGVGDITSNVYGSNGVLYSIDGVVIDRPTSISPNFFDLERVEVLKGPQGTLYGRNSTGGAINLLSRRPEDRLGGYLTAEAGNYDAVNLTGALNIPVTDQLKARAAFQVARHDGYLSDGRNDDDRRSVRLSLLYNPSKAFSLLVVGDIQHLAGKGPGGALLSPSIVAPPWTGPSDPIVLSHLPPIAIKPDITQAFLDYDFRNIMAEANADLGFAKLTVVGGYRDVSGASTNAQPGFQVAFKETAQQATVEARLSHQSDILKWVAGGYYFDESQSSTLNAQISNVIPLLNAVVSTPYLPTRSYGLFGETTYSPLKSVRLIGGLRYTHERKLEQGALIDQSTAQIPTLSLTGDASFSKVTWKLGAEYDLAPRNMIYATVSTGFKAGGFSPVAAPNNNFNPETLTSFVVGSRNRFLDNRLQINGEGFYWKYKNYQASILGPQANGFTGNATLNAGSATIYGFDLDVVGKIAKDDTIRVVGEYLNSNFDDFSYVRSTSGLVPGVTVGCPLSGAPFTIFGGPVQTVNCSGFSLPRSPTLSGTGSYEHVFALANGGNVSFKGSATYSGARWLGLEYVATERAPAYASFDADLTYHSPSGRLSLTGYIRNIGDKASYTNATFQPLSAGQMLFAAISAPRTYGVRASVNF